MTTTTGSPHDGLLALRGYESGGIRVLELVGECDLANADALAHSLGDALTTHPDTLVVDLTNLTYCDAGSAGQLIDVAGLVPVVLAGTTRGPARVLDLLAPRALLPRYPTVAAALAALALLAALPEPASATGGAPKRSPAPPPSRTSAATGAANSTAAAIHSSHAEAERLAAVRRYDILDTAPDSVFDRITSLAARLFGVGTAIVSIVDEHRIWFKSHHGTDVTEVSRDPAAPSDLVVAAELGMQFYAGAALVTADGHHLGTVALFDKEPRLVTDEETRTLNQMAELVVDALEMRLAASRAVELQVALRAAEEDKRHDAEELARTLQESLLPPHLPDLPGVDLAARYLPAAGGTEVVGDFYDVFQSGRQSWGIVMGDVCGTGVEAAKITALARYTLRAAAMRDSAPSKVLGTLNQAMLNRGDQQEPFGPEAERFLTAVYLTLRPNREGANITLCSAGHTPALLRRADGVVSSVGYPGTILGLFATPELGLRDTRVHLDPGDTLLLYTDGVTEARRGHEFYGEDRLRRLLQRAEGLDVVALSASIEDDVVAFSGGALSDDTAVLVVAVPARHGRTSSVQHGTRRATNAQTTGVGVGVGDLAPGQIPASRQRTGRPFAIITPSAPRLSLLQGGDGLPAQPRSRTRAQPTSGGPAPG